MIDERKMINQMKTGFFDELVEKMATSNTAEAIKSRLLEQWKTINEVEMSIADMKIDEEE